MSYLTDLPEYNWKYFETCNKEIPNYLFDNDFRRIIKFRGFFAKVAQTGPCGREV